MANKKLWVYRLSALAFGFMLALAFSELLLRVFRPDIAAKDINQLKVSFYGDKNQVTIKNLRGTALDNPKLDSIIYRTTNNIRFRGPDLPDDNDSLYKIIAVGGSTTICEYLSDGQDWPNLVGSALHQKDSSIWMNNAGVDGHSTFGHIKLLPEIILPKHPQMILFLVGGNDVFRNHIGEDDGRKMGLLQNEIHTYSIIYDNFYLYRLSSNLFFYFKSKYFDNRQKLYHFSGNFRKSQTMPLNGSQRCEKIRRLEKEFIPGSGQSGLKKWNVHI